MRHLIVRTPDATATLAIGTVKSKEVCLAAPSPFGWCVWKSPAALRAYAERRGWLLEETEAR